jgi:hypothetical protein
MALPMPLAAPVTTIIRSLTCMGFPYELIIKE